MINIMRNKTYKTDNKSYKLIISLKVLVFISRSTHDL